MSRPRHPMACGGCKFWAGHIDPERGDGIGICHRFPPHKDEKGTQHWPSKHPNTLDTDWCGEYQPAEEDRYKDVT